ncbi:MAG: hypothetical protein IT179_04625 [Acidobacteria bacterium]|nr:hypothetical protein [Acidobacteriota bacterium]
MSADVPSPDETEPPVPELAAFELPLDEAFVTRVRCRIERRVLAGDLAELAWSGPLAAVIALLRAPFDWFTTHD